MVCFKALAIDFGRSAAGHGFPRVSLVIPAQAGMTVKNPDRGCCLAETSRLSEAYQLRLDG